MRIALAHDWLCGYRGGEAVLDRIARIVAAEHEPAGLYVMVDDGRPLTPAIDALDRRTSWLQHIPGGPTRLRRWLLAAYPSAVTGLSRRLASEHRRRPIDLLISTSSAAIKGLRAPAGVAHLCYCHSPARYVWSQADQYARGSAGPLRAMGLRLVRRPFRRWDRRTASHVTRFLANSRHTADEIRRCYERDAEVVHPPVRTDLFTPADGAGDEDGTRGDGYFLLVGALEPYKRADLAIAAARRAGWDLRIVGDGSQRRRLESSKPGNVRFLGRVSDDELVHLYRGARALIFPQVEDFGITAVEAQACGCPVIARRAGGALESVVDGVTGALFDEPTPEAFIDAAERLPPTPIEACRRNAERFCESAFDDAIRAQISLLTDPATTGTDSRTPAPAGA